MKLARAEVNGKPTVILRGRQSAVAQVDGQMFADLPDLLESCGGDPARITPGPGVSVDDAALLAVTEHPKRIFCIGLNYRAHAAESGSAPPTTPIIFPKWDGSLTGPYSEIPLPPESSQVDWESEMAFIISRRCRRVKAADAASVVFGYTVANDTSMRDWQLATSQWGPGKSWERSSPVGPVLVTIDELGGILPKLALRGRLNGDVMQDINTADLIFDVGALVENLSTFMTLEAGDLVITGTGEGVGVARKPPVFIQDGDVFEVELEGVGTLRNRFVTEQVD